MYSRLFRPVAKKTPHQTLSKNRSYLYILSGPSGVGKTTIMNRLLTDIQNLEKIVGYTTRSMRPGEIQDKTYHFINRSEFQAKQSHHDFLISLEFSGNLYGFGLTKNEMLAKLDQGIDLITDLDYSQIADLKKEVENCFAIFIMPPSIDSLSTRLFSRGDAKETIEKRMQYANDIMNHAYLSDTIVINQDSQLEATISKIKDIINTHRLHKNDVTQTNVQLNS